MSIELPERKNSIIYKTKFGKLVKVDDLKDSEKYLSPCDPNLGVEEIPKIILQNKKSMPNQGLYLKSSHRDKTFLYSEKDLDVPLCYLSKKRKKEYNKLKKTRRNQAKQRLIEELKLKEEEEQEQQRVKNEERRLQRIEDKRIRDEKRNKLREARRKRKDARKQALQNLKDKKLSELKKERETDILDKYYRLMDKLDELYNKMTNNNKLQKNELNIKLIQLKLTHDFKLFDDSFDKNKIYFKKFINLLLLKNLLDTNKYMIKLYTLSFEIKKLLQTDDIKKEILNNSDTEEILKELNNKYFKIYLLYNSKNQFFSKKKNIMGNIQPIGDYIYKNAILPVKNLRLEVSSSFSNIDNKDYIESEMKKYNIILKILYLQKTFLNMSKDLSKETNIKLKEILTLSNEEKQINNEIKYFEQELSKIKSSYANVTTSKIKEELEDLKLQTGNDLNLLL